MIHILYIYIYIILYTWCKCLNEQEETIALPSQDYGYFKAVRFEGKAYGLGCQLPFQKLGEALCKPRSPAERNQHTAPGKRWSRNLNLTCEQLWAAHFDIDIIAVQCHHYILLEWKRELFFLHLFSARLISHHLTLCTHSLPETPALNPSAQEETLFWRGLSQGKGSEVPCLSISPLAWMGITESSKVTIGQVLDRAAIRVILDARASQKREQHLWHLLTAVHCALKEPLKIWDHWWKKRSQSFYSTSFNIFKACFEIPQQLTTTLSGSNCRESWRTLLRSAWHFGRDAKVVCMIYIYINIYI